MLILIGPARTGPFQAILINWNFSSSHLLLRLISTLLKLEISTLLKTITNSCFQALEGLKFQALEGLKFQDEQTQKQMIRPIISKFNLVRPLTSTTSN